MEKTMEQPALKFYPVGIQTFSDMREENYLYIDKTEHVYRMTHSAGKYMFRQVAVGEHASRLFRRTERFVPRFGDRTVGKRMDTISGAALRHEPWQAHEGRGTATVPA